MKMESKKQSGKNNINGQRFNLGLLLAVSVFALVVVSGLAVAQTAFAGVDQNGDGSIDPYEACLGSAVGASCNPPWLSWCSTRIDPKCVEKPPLCTDDVQWGRDGQRVCIAKGKCTDNDKDGKEVCVPTKNSDWPSGKRREDCDDNDPWSHVYASANIKSISVNFDPDYVAWAKSVRNYTPKTPYSLRDTIKISVTFTQKCGIQPYYDYYADDNDFSKPPSSPMDVGVYIVRGDGVEIPVGSLNPKYDPVRDVYVDNVYETSVDLRNLMTEEMIASIAKNPNWRLKFVGEDLVDDLRGSAPLAVTKDTPQYRPLPMTNHTKKLIVIGGLGAPARHKIFSTIGDLAPGSIKIPLRLKSPARNTTKIREEINKQLVEGNEVLVVGHSMGAILAYNLQKEFAAANKCVSGVYIDPPYNFIPCKIPLVNLLPYVSDIKKAACGGIDSDSGIVDWTNGHGLGHFFSHDAFTFPNHVGSDGRTGRQKVEALIKVVKSRLGDSFSVCSFGSVPPPTSLKTAPQITGVLSSSRPITSVRPGDTITVTGSGFSPAGNIVDIQHATYAQVYYELFNVPSTNNGKTLTFVLPPSPVPPIQTVPGRYFLKVSAVNSDWSNALTVQVSK